MAKSFGAVIRRLRVASGTAQDAFALAAGVDRSYYGKLERGERQPSLALMLRIAAALEVACSELIRQVEASLEQPKRPKARLPAQPARKGLP